MDSNFDANYYDRNYYVTVNGKKFKREDGTECSWSYANSEGEWLGCAPICEVWKNIFGLSGVSKVLDVGCGRGTFIGYLVDLGINAEGFDFSEFAVKNPYSRCPKERLRQHDATVRWPYLDGVFDLTIALDLFEHLYNDGDIDKVIGEMYRVSGKWIFLQIAGINGGSGAMVHDDCYILKRGEKIPVRLEGCAVAGHVTVQTKDWWVSKLGKGMNNNNRFIFRDDLVSLFIKKTPADVVSNWVKNIIIILERV
jgi:SAM-dependent methyltransferase